MKYRIKRQFASILMDVKGLHMTPSESWNYVNVHVFDDQFLRNFNPPNKPAILPKNCDSELVDVILEQIQRDKTTSEQVKILREYLQCAEKKDKNNEIKSSIKEAFKEVFLGLLLIVVGGVGGFALVVFLVGLLPAIASWISLLIIPSVAVAVCGIIKAGIGCLKLGIGIFSFCFRQKNVEQLPALENELHRFCLQSTQPPPSYQEVMENKAIASAPVFNSEPPTYQQAVRNAAIATRPVMPSINIPGLILSNHSTYFFHPFHSVSQHQVMHENPSISRIGP